MGYGQIVGGGEDGLYTVKLDFGKTRRDAWVASLAGLIEDLNIRIADAEAAIVAARDRREAAEAKLQALLADLRAAAGGPGTAEILAKIDIATGEFVRAQAAEDMARMPREQLIVERKDLVKRKNDLESLAVEETRQAWCVDFTQAATGYVGTIEVPGEDQAILIAPGGRAPLPTDGYLVARELLSPHAAFFGAAILPGWQKWKPTYRKGTVISVNQETNLADVSLDNATSSANQLPVNQSAALSAVPVIYMDCHAEVFEAGDRVIVQFLGQDWSAPRVIGFVDHPRPCLRIRVVYAINGAVVFDEEFYDGDTAPGYTAPAFIEGENDFEEAVSRPFIGWNNGTNSLAHPEFDTELPTTYYYINAQYAAVGVSHYWQISPEYQPPNDQYFETTSNESFTFVSRYERSQYIGTVTGPASVAAAILGALSIETDPWYTEYVGGLWGTYPIPEEPAYPEPSTTAIPYPMTGPSISDFVPGTYSQSETLTSGWVVTWTKALKLSTKYYCFHDTTVISAVPP